MGFPREKPLDRSRPCCSYQECGEIFCSTASFCYRGGRLGPDIFSSTPARLAAGCGIVISSVQRTVRLCRVQAAPQLLRATHVMNLSWLPVSLRFEPLQELTPPSPASEDLEHHKTSIGSQGTVNAAASRPQKVGSPIGHYCRHRVGHGNLITLFGALEADALLHPSFLLLSHLLRALDDYLVLNPEFHLQSFQMHIGAALTVPTAARRHTKRIAAVRCSPSFTATIKSTRLLRRPASKGLGRAVGRASDANCDACTRRAQKNQGCCSQAGLTAAVGHAYCASLSAVHTLVGMLTMAIMRLTSIHTLAAYIKPSVSSAVAPHLVFHPFFLVIWLSIWLDVSSCL